LVSPAKAFIEGTIADNPTAAAPVARVPKKFLRLVPSLVSLVFIKQVFVLMKKVREATKKNNSTIGRWVFPQ
jgi:hypothetical protein